MAPRRSLLTGGLASLAVVPLIAAGPPLDAALIDLCARYVAADQRHERLCARQDAMPKGRTPSRDAEWSRLDDMVLDEGVLMLDLEPQITALAATTSTGIRAKASAVARLTRNLSDQNGGAMLRSLLADLMPEARA